jgi:ABC-type Fe3+ transport system permease subunit
MSLWNLGPMMIIFLAALQDVPQQLYDAVSIDGGGAWARLWHVTIPLITPAILFNLVIGLVGSLQTFTQAYVMTDGGPNNASLFLVFYIYREGFRNSNIGYASALSWGLFAIIAVLSAIVLPRPGVGFTTKAVSADEFPVASIDRQSFVFARAGRADLPGLRGDRDRADHAFCVARPLFADGRRPNLRVSASVDV